MALKQTVVSMIPPTWRIHENPINFKIIFPKEVDGINGFSISKFGQELKCFKGNAYSFDVDVDVTCQLIGWTDPWDTLKFASDANILFDFLREKIPLILGALEEKNSSSNSGDQDISKKEDE